MIDSDKLAKLENLALEWVNEEFGMEISAFPLGELSSAMNALSQEH